MSCEINLLNSKIKELIKAIPVYCILTGFGELENITVKGYALECVDLCADSSFEGIRNKITLKDPIVMDTE